MTYCGNRIGVRDATTHQMEWFNSQAEAAAFEREQIRKRLATAKRGPVITLAPATPRRSYRDAGHDVPGME